MNLYQQYIITDSEEKLVYGTIWVNTETHEVDEDNLPRPRELLEIFKGMVRGEVKARPTPNIVREDE